MKQNNERVDITPLEQINAVQSIRNSETLDDALRVMNGLAANGWLKLWDNATHPDGSSYRDKPPVLQNEQQEAVTNLWEALGKWSAYLASNGEQANLAPPSWLIDAVSSSTSPHKQIPEGWKIVPIESDEQMKEEARAFLTGLELGVKTFESMSEHLRLSGAYLPDWFLNSKGHINKMAKAHYIYESMLNAAPTNMEEGDE